MKQRYTTEYDISLSSDEVEGEMEIISKDILNAWSQLNFPRHGIIPPRFDSRHWNQLPLPGMRTPRRRLKNLSSKEKRTILTLLRLFDETTHGSLPHSEYIKQLKATIEAHNKPDSPIRNLLYDISQWSPAQWAIAISVLLGLILFLITPFLP